MSTCDYCRAPSRPDELGIVEHRAFRFYLCQACRLRMVRALHRQAAA